MLHSRPGRLLLLSTSQVDDSGGAVLAGDSKQATPQVSAGDAGRRTTLQGAARHLPSDVSICATQLDVQVPLAARIGPRRRRPPIIITITIIIIIMIISVSAAPAASRARASEVAGGGSISNYPPRRARYLAAANARPVAPAGMPAPMTTIDRFVRSAGRINK